MDSNAKMLSEEEDVILEFGEEDIDTTKRLRHPVAVFFHIIFRVGALLAYLFCGLFSSSFITSFIIILVLLSMDFWTVKNISGRLLVGLRWWNYVDEDGKSNWIYESRKGQNRQKISALESRIFWLSLIVCQILWIVFFFAALISLKFMWLLVALVGVLMNGANVFGYLRCKYSSKTQLSSAATSFLSTQFFKNMFSRAQTEPKQTG